MFSITSLISRAWNALRSPPGGVALNFIVVDVVVVAAAGRGRFQCMYEASCGEDKLPVTRGWISSPPLMRSTPYVVAGGGGGGKVRVMLVGGLVAPHVAW